MRVAASHWLRGAPLLQLQRMGHRQGSAPARRASACQAPLGHVGGMQGQAPSMPLRALTC